MATRKRKGGRREPWVVVGEVDRVKGMGDRERKRLVNAPQLLSATKHRGSVEDDLGVSRRKETMSLAPKRKGESLREENQTGITTKGGEGEGRKEKQVRLSDLEEKD